MVCGGKKSQPSRERVEVSQHFFLGLPSSQDVVYVLEP